MKVCICGVPRAGKTTMAEGYQRTLNVLHTDDLIDSHAWSHASEAAAAWFDRPEAHVTIEGVAAVRALRKWLDSHPTGRPCDRVVWLDTPRVPLTPGQQAMAKGCRTVWRQIEAALRARGVDVLCR